MPLYEYQCEKCGKVFERIQKYSDAPLTVHDDCGGKVEKLLSAPGFHFKGSGWYVTDYGKGGSKPEAKSDSSASDGEKKEKTESKSEGKSDTKSEGKSEGSGAKSESKPASETKTESKPAAPAAKSD